MTSQFLVAQGSPEVAASPEAEIKEIAAPEGEVIRADFATSYTFPAQADEVLATRHIFIFLDGTWNEERSLGGIATPTNVLRMYQQLNHESGLESSGAGHKIIARYYRGVGSRQDCTTANRFWFGFNGKDEQRIRAAAFAGLYCDYKSKNDCIYILGFSRGAASARLLAKDICDKGFPPELDVDTTYFPNLLTGQVEARVVRLTKKFAGQNSGKENYRPKIAFLGCWDTVDAFVLPSRFPGRSGFDRLKDATVRAIKSTVPRVLGWERFRQGENEIPDKVEKAVHCVAIDETRHAFLPTLMPHAANVEEVWFPGVHADVGGGYDDNVLAQAPYDFMKNRLSVAFKAHGGDPGRLLKAESETFISPQFCFHFHGLNSGLGQLKDIAGFGTSIRRIRVLNPPDNTVKPKIHASIHAIRKSDAVFAANRAEKRTWRIVYDPYNVRELLDKFDIACEDTDITVK
jgi:hypothetical protein